MVRTRSEDNFQGLVFAFPCQARESPASAALHTGDQLARKPLAGSPVWPAYPAAETTGERHPPDALSYGLQGPEHWSCVSDTSTLWPSC